MRSRCAILWSTKPMPSISWLYISITTGQGTGIFVTDSFICNWIADIDCISEMLMNSIVNRCWLNKPFISSIFFRKLIFVIISLYLFFLFHFCHSFLINSSSTNAVKDFVKKLNGKGLIVEEIVKESGTDCVVKAFCQDRNNNGSKVFFSAFFLIKAQDKLLYIFCLACRVVPKFKPPFYSFILHIMPNAGFPLKIDHVFINALKWNH